MLIGTHGAFAQELVISSSMIARLTHSYGNFAPGGAATTIEDYAAAGQFTQTSFATTLSGSEMVATSFEAPAGEMFAINAAPDGFGDITLTLDAEWTAGADYGLSPVSSSTVFENLIGLTPTLTSSSDCIGAGGKWVRFFDTFTVTPGTEFTGIQLSAQYATSVSSPSQQTFTPAVFTFRTQASSSQTLGDGTLMTLEATPEPGVLSLFGMGSFCLFSIFYRRSPPRIGSH